MSDYAIVMLAIGDQILADWRRYCAVGWQAYAERHGIDLVIVTEPFERSERSLAWQKCLVCEQPFAARYRQIALVDSDIAINPAAPNVFAQVPPMNVGGVISGSHVHEDLRPLLLSRLRHGEVKYEHGKLLWQLDQNWYYEHYGLAPRPEGIIQSGVLVVDPRRHGAIFRGVYDAVYRETRLYEQVPLSHALLTAGVFQQIDTRFNSILHETMLVHHFYVWDEPPPSDQVFRAIVRAEVANNFFLHFAYNRTPMRFLVDES